MKQYAKPYLLKSVPGHYKTQKMCERAIERGSWMVEYVFDRYKTHKICETAIERMLYALEYVKKPGKCVPRLYVGKAIPNEMYFWSLQDPRDAKRDNAYPPAQAFFSWLL